MPARTDEGGTRGHGDRLKKHDHMLRALAKKHNVSVAWLIRYAVSQLVEQASSVQLSLDLTRRQ